VAAISGAALALPAGVMTGVSGVLSSPALIGLGTAAGTATTLDGLRQDDARQTARGLLELMTMAAPSAVNRVRALPQFQALAMNAQAHNTQVEVARQIQKAPVDEAIGWVMSGLKGVDDVAGLHGGPVHQALEGKLGAAAKAGDTKAQAALDELGSLMQGTGLPAGAGMKSAAAGDDAAAMEHAPLALAEALGVPLAQSGQVAGGAAAIGNADDVMDLPGLQFLRDGFVPQTPTQAAAQDALSDIQANGAAPMQLYQRGADGQIVAVDSAGMTPQEIAQGLQAGRFTLGGEVDEARELITLPAQFASDEAITEDNPHGLLYDALAEVRGRMSAADAAESARNPAHIVYNNMLGGQEVVRAFENLRANMIGAIQESGYTPQYYEARFGIKAEEIEQFSRGESNLNPDQLDIILKTLDPALDLTGSRDVSHKASYHNIFNGEHGDFLIANGIRQLMQEKNMNIDGLAEKTGFKPSMISSYLGATHNKEPDWEKTAKILEALEVNPEDFLSKIAQESKDELVRLEDRNLFEKFVGHILGEGNQDLRQTFADLYKKERPLHNSLYRF
jgi:transcriptional regulator with XRE-family HTH domain